MILELKRNSTRGHACMAFRFLRLIAFILLTSISSRAQDGYLETSKVYGGHRLNGFGGGGLDASENYLLIGTELSQTIYLNQFGSSGGYQAGSVDLFRRIAGTDQWTVDGGFTPSQSQPGDFFGISVGISEDYAVVGANGDDNLGSQSGSAEVYKRYPNGWYNVTLKKLLASDGAPGDQFGKSVSIDGEWILVSAEYNDDHGSNSGSAYLFRRDHGGVDNWGQFKKLVAPDASSVDYFGSEVKIVGDLAFVSATGMRAVYIFQKDQGGIDNWGFIKKVVPLDASATSFGDFFSVDGDYLLVNTWAETAYLFSRHEGGANNWGQVKKFTTNPPQTGQQFGRSLSIAGSNVFVGAGLYDHQGTNSGAIYWFQKDQGGVDNWGFKKLIHCSTQGQSDEFGNTVMAVNDLLVAFNLGEGEIHTFKAASIAGTSPPGIMGIPASIEVADNVNHTIFSSATINDPDIPAQNLTVTLTLSNTSIGTTSGSFTALGNGVYRFVGTAAQATAAIRALVFQPANDLVAIGQSTSSNLTLSVDDQLHPAAVHIMDLTTLSVNESPTISNASFDVYVQFEQGHIVGALQATDPDASQDLSFSIPQGNDGGHFSVSNTGQLIIADNNFDPQEANLFTLQVQVTDNGTPPQAATATVNLILMDSIFMNPVQIFDPEAIPADSRFATSVSICGSIAVAGNPADAAGGADSGSISIFEKDPSGNWQLVQKITAPHPGIRFGFGVQVIRDWIFVSAPYDNERGTYSGALYIYNKGASGVWEVFQKLAPDGLQQYNYFAENLHANDTTLAVSARVQRVNGINGAGAVYFYELTSDHSWQLNQMVTSPAPQASDFFSGQFTFSGESLVVLAPNADDFCTNCGALYAYQLVDGQWQYQQTIGQTGDVNYRFIETNGDLLVTKISNTPHITFYQKNANNNFEVLNIVSGMANGTEEGQFFGDLFVLQDNLTIKIFKDNWGPSGWGMIQRFIFPYNSTAITDIYTDGSQLMLGHPDNFNWKNFPASARIFQRKGLNNVTENFDEDLSLPDKESVNLFTNLDLDYQGTVTATFSIEDTSMGSFSASAEFQHADGAWATTGTIAEVLARLHGVTYTPVENRVTPGESELAIINLTITSASGSILLEGELAIESISINDPPSFAPGQNINVVENSGVYSGEWATNISDGDIEDQQLTFMIEVDNQSLFSSQPAISSDGTLTFTLAAQQHGEAVISVQLNDNAEQNNLSTMLEFTIAVQREPVHLIVADTIVTRNNEVIIPVTTTGFENILGLQFTVEWNPQIAQFVNINHEAASGIMSGDFNLTYVDDGRITFAWAQPSGNSITLAPHDTLFAIRFMPVGNYGEATPVIITASPTPIEAVEQGFGLVPVTTHSGEIQISQILTLTGTVNYSHGEPVPGVTMAVSGSEIHQTITGVDGIFTFELSPQNSEAHYTVTPAFANDTDLLNGIDVQDVALIRRHVLGTQTFTSPYQSIAADVSGNNSISVQDIVILQAVILTVEDNFPNGTQWEFIDAHHQLSQLAPFDYPAHISPTLSQLEHAEPMNFIAVKMGDVDFSRGGHGSGRSNNQEVILETGLKEIDHNTLDLSIRAYGFVDISGYQFTLNWKPDQLSWVAMTSEMNANLGLKKLADGVVTVIWDNPQGRSTDLEDGALIMVVRFRKIASEVSQPAISGDVTPMKMFDRDLRPVEIMLREEIFEEPFVSGSFYPNPFGEHTSISFSSVENQTADIEIIDGSGRLILASSRKIFKGWNELIVSGADLMPGLYVVTIRLREKILRGKMIKQ